MKMRPHRRCGVTLIASIMFISAACTTKEPRRSDRPRLTPGVSLQDVTFRSAALNRDMQYRVISPLAMESGQKLKVVYLLHGRDAGFRDWSNYSDVA